MENKDLGSKKINGKQEVNEDAGGKINEVESNASKFKKELETDTEGNKKIVERARNVDGSGPDLPDQIETNELAKEGLNRGVTTEKETKKTVENIDRNSDITPNRYPNSHPDNHENRGNANGDD